MTQPHSMISEKTLFIIKPDGVQRALIGEVISRFEKKGLKIAALKMVKPTSEQAANHYSAFDDAWREKVGGFVKSAYEKNNKEFPYANQIEAGQAVQDSLARYMSTGPIVVMVIQGPQAIEHVRKLLGSTDPSQADIGTIRGDFTIESIDLANTDDRPVRNLAHASDSVEGANREINVWFTKEELVNYNLAIDEILYDPEWDAVREEITSGE